ncbi:MAG: hypothetical protein ACI8PT_000641 [Gammaproteobacteria bacterium]|jgi:hypothetical protein
MFAANAEMEDSPGNLLGRGQWFEPKIYQAAQVYRRSFFERPVAVGLVILALVSVWVAWCYSPQAVETYSVDGPSTGKVLQLVFTGFLFVLMLYALDQSIGYAGSGNIFPVTVVLIALAFLSATWVMMGRTKVAATLFCARSVDAPHGPGVYYFLGWAVGMPALVAVFGMPRSFSPFTSWHVPRRRCSNAGVALGAETFLGVMPHFLTLRYPARWQPLMVNMPWWLGG